MMQINWYLYQNESKGRAYSTVRMFKGLYSVLTWVETERLMILAYNSNKHDKWHTNSLNASDRKQNSCILALDSSNCK